MLHHIFRLVQGGSLFVAPLREPSRVLDMGTGTGIWAVHFAEYVKVI
jgi:ubiquinone/menaquinone biosynthesis C-methylase UbiE